MKSEFDWSLHLERMRKHCEDDRLRNDVIAPWITSKLTYPCSVADIGVGSGWLIPALLRNTEQLQRAVLVDKNEKVLEFAERCLSAVSAIKIETVCSDIEASEFRTANQVNVVCLVFTLLELVPNGVVLENIKKLIDRGGACLVVLPDVLEELVSSAGNGRSLLEYCDGCAKLKKWDKYVLADVPYFGNRIEGLIALFLANGFALNEIIRKPYLPHHEAPRTQHAFLLEFIYQAEGPGGEAHGSTIGGIPLPHKE